MANKRIGQQRLGDFVPVADVAEELGMNRATIKRWLKGGKVENVAWGRDRRGWIFVSRDSIELLRAYRDSIRVQTPKS